MTSWFYEDEGSKLLKPGVFEFVLTSELKRAVRLQNYLTLVVVETHREWKGMAITVDEGMLHDVAKIIRREIRDTDLLAHTDEGILMLVLLDADLHDATNVVERVGSRINRQRLPTALRIAVGAACFPTDAADAGSLKTSGALSAARELARQAASRSRIARQLGRVQSDLRDPALTRSSSVNGPRGHRLSATNPTASTLVYAICRSADESEHW